MKTLFLIFLLLPPFVAAVSAQGVNVCSGTVKRLEKFESKFVDARNVDVWLPDGYSAKKKYAVLYMHDGQMLFDASTTWNKQEWEVDETIGRLLKNGKIKDVIVVGVWNNGEKRRMEYAPQKAFNYLSPQDKIKLAAEVDPNTKKPLFGELLADNYLRFLVQELKPYIDKNFSTKKDRDNTFVAGSSMGGLISMYAISEYPEIFGGAACLSTHWVGLFRADNNPIPAAIMAYMRDKLPAPKNHKIYFDYGTATLDALYPPFQAQVDEIMRKKGFTETNWTTRAFAGEDHSEKAWAKRFEIPLMFLLGK